MAARDYGDFYSRASASYFYDQFEIYSASVMMMRAKVHLPLSEHSGEMKKCIKSKIYYHGSFIYCIINIKTILVFSRIDM